MFTVCDSRHITKKSLVTTRRSKLKSSLLKRLLRPIILLIRECNILKQAYISFKRWPHRTYVCVCACNKKYYCKCSNKTHKRQRFKSNAYLSNPTAFFSSHHRPKLQKRRRNCSSRNRNQSKGRHIESSFVEDCPRRTGLSTERAWKEPFVGLRSKF